MDPFSWLMIISAVLGYFQTADNASNQEEAIKKNQNLQANDRMRKQDEAFRQGTAETNALARQGQADMALFNTIAGEYGGGASASRAGAVRSIQAGERMATIQTNSRLGLNQLGFDGMAADQRSASQLGAIEQPSLIKTGLQIGSAYYGDPSRRPAKKTPAPE